MEVTCAACGRVFAALTARRKYCSGRCRSRAFEARARQARPGASPTADVGSIRAAIIAHYSPDDLAEVEGLVALRLAADVDTSPPDIPGYAALIRQLREALKALDAATTSTRVTPLAALRARRAADRMENR